MSTKRERISSQLGRSWDSAQQSVNKNEKKMIKLNQMGQVLSSKCDKRNVAGT
jgi:hypothetical protein